MPHPLRIALMSFVFGLAARAHAQTAPYILPYTMSTYAGAHAAYTAGDPCGTNVALNSAGDGCLAPFVAVGSDPHDVRVDAQGYVYYIDDTLPGGIVHKINPYTLLETVAAGTTTAKVCSTFITGAPSSATEGDGCTVPASDGVANTTFYASYLTKPGRGIGIGFNGDLYIAGYTDQFVHRVAAATGLMSVVAGNGKATSPAGNVPASTPVATSTVDQPRGVSADINGNVFFADSADNIIRENSNGIITNLTALNTAGTSKKDTGIPASQALADTPEDTQVDPFGNVYIADEANGIVRAIYGGNGPFFGISNPQVGYIYTIAGGGSTGTGGSNPGTSGLIKGTSIKFIARKIGIDNLGNVYIGDGSSTGILAWFVDHITGYARIIAGNYNQAATTTPAATCPTATDVYGDGCPATQASLYARANMPLQPDSHGNLYIGDNENSTPALSMIRKVLSGLNFPATSTGTAVTQNILVHFAPGDTAGGATPYVISASAGSGNDFKLGTATCNSASTPNPDTTDDCLLQVTFTPSQPGFETANLTVTSALGSVANFQLTGTGTAPLIAFDPGNTALVGAGAAGQGLKNLQGVTLDSAGNAYIADTGNNRVLFYNAQNGASSVFAGGASSTCPGATDSLGDGCPAIQATLNAPKSVAIDTNGVVYIADSGNNVIRAVSPTSGKISTYAGGAAAVCAQAIDTFGDGCPAVQTRFASPSGITADNLGNLYVSDTGNNLIRLITSNSSVSVFAGTNFSGQAGTPCTAAQGATDSVGDGCTASQPVLTGGLLTGFTGASFNAPTGIAFDYAGKSIVVADTGNHRVRRIGLSPAYTITGKATVSNIMLAPVTSIAGNGSAGTEIAQGSIAANTELNAPTGVAVGADGTVYIADTGNNSVRMVTTSGIITTIAGINSAKPGTGKLGAATVTQFNLPAAVAVSPLGTLWIADSGNSRLVTDTRTQVRYDFGVIGVTLTSPVQNFTELNIGTAPVTLPSPLFTQSPLNSNFSFSAGSNTNGSISGCNSGTLAPGAICNMRATYSPSASATESTTYSQAGTNSVGGTPSIGLTGTGAILVTTTSTAVQISPVPPASAVFGGSVTVQITVKPTGCSTSTTDCFAAGDVVIVEDGNAHAPITLPAGSGSGTPVPLSVTEVLTNLSVGTHTITCSYSGDNFYSASSCAPLTFTVAPAPTVATLSATPNNAPQFTTTHMSVTVSSAAGNPTGTVTFYANGTALGQSAVDPNTGLATLNLQQVLDASGNQVQVSNSTLNPGTYTLTCSYTGPANSDFAASTCAGLQFVVTAAPQSITLFPVGCSYSGLSNQGTINPINIKSSCPTPEVSMNGYPVVATADGSTGDATVFVEASNSVSGAVSMSCSGLPQYAVCGFSPSVLTVSASTTYTSPIPIDVTFWTDVSPSAANSAQLQRTRQRGSELALLLGFPVALLCLSRGRNRNLRLLGLFVGIACSSLFFNGCAGPGAAAPKLTPGGTYPVVVTMKVGNVTGSTTVYLQVASPGKIGLQ